MSSKKTKKFSPGDHVFFTRDCYLDEHDLPSGSKLIDQSVIECQYELSSGNYDSVLEVKKGASAIVLGCMNVFLKEYRYEVASYCQLQPMNSVACGLDEWCVHEDNETLVIYYDGKIAFVEDYEHLLLESKEKFLARKTCSASFIVDIELEAAGEKDIKEISKRLQSIATNILDKNAVGKLVDVRFEERVAASEKAE